MIHELRLEPGPSAYRADWAITSMSPSQHLGYAVQWFALAAALLALFIYFGVHQARGSAVSTMNPTLSSGEGKRGRGRLQLLLIIGVVLGPMLLASAMYRFGFWVPESRSYDGVLIANGQDRAAIGVSATAPERRWELLVTAPQGCEAQCQQLVYLARQINIGLAREAARAGHALASATALDEAYEQRLRREYPQLQRHTLDAAVYARNPEAPATPNCGSSTPTAIWCCATTSAPTARRFSTT